MRSLELPTALAMIAFGVVSCRPPSPAIDVVAGADESIRADPEWRQKITALWEDATRAFEAESGLAVRLSELASWYPRDTGAVRRRLWSGLPANTERRDAIAVFVQGARPQSRGTPFDDRMIIVINLEGAQQTNSDALQQSFRRMLGVEGANPHASLLRAMAQFPIKGGLDHWTEDKDRYLRSAWQTAGKSIESLRLLLTEVLDSQGLTAHVVRYRSEMAAANPADPALLFALAVAQQKDQRPNDAAATLGKLLALSPGYEGVHRELGIAYALTNRRSDAEASFEKALQLNPGDDVARLNLGVLIVDQLGRRDEGTEHFREILRRSPGHVAARTNLQLALAAHRSLASKIATLERDLAGNESADKYLQLGIAYARLGKLSGAATALTRAAKMDPSSQRARQNLATVALLRGDYATALEEVRQMKSRGMSVDPQFEAACLRGR